MGPYCLRGMGARIVSPFRPTSESPGKWRASCADGGAFIIKVYRDGFIPVTRAWSREYQCHYAWFIYY